MDIKDNSQFELFPSELPRSADLEIPGYKLKDLTLSPENIIVLCIILIMTLVLFFSFGVERGKALVNGGSVDQDPASENKPLSTVESGAGQIKVDRSAPVSIVIQRPLPVLTTPAAVSKPLGQPVFKQKEIELKMPVVEAKTTTGSYTIQVASFKSHQTAQKEALHLKTTGLDAFILSKGVHSIVCVGRFGDMAKAKQTSDKLKYKYQDNLVRRF